MATASKNAFQHSVTSPVINKIKRIAIRDCERVNANWESCNPNVINVQRPSGLAPDGFHRPQSCAVKIHGVLIRKKRAARRVDRNGIRECAAAIKKARAVRGPGAAGAATFVELSHV